MIDTKNKCPSAEMFIKYFHRDLNNSELMELGRHFSECDACMDKYYYYENFIEQAYLSSVVQKELLANSNADTFSVAAASGCKNEGVSEITSSDGKYKLKLMQFSDEPEQSILEITLKKTAENGILRIELLEDSGCTLLGKSPIEGKQKICFEVDSSINLNNLLITMSQQKLQSK